MKRRGSIAIVISLLTLICLPSANCADLKGELKGVLVWFYSLETKDGKEQGNVLKFKQTAGVSCPHHVIHEIRPLSPQSKVTKDEDDNWFLDLAESRVVVRHDRPLFLGQVLSITKSGNVPIQIPSDRNIPLSQARFDSDLGKYLVDRKDLLITDPAITKVRDQLLADNPRILSYIVAVDRFVCDKLKYGPCQRPNTAVDLLGSDKGRCGEYAKLKQSLLRSAGIPTRDVYATRTDTYGPGIDDGDDSHVWLQAFVPRVGWIEIQSTSKLNNKFFSFLGGDHPEGRYLRAIDLYKHDEDVQKKEFTYNALQQPGGVRGNGMLLKINAQLAEQVHAVTNRILDYNSVPDDEIFKDIERLPLKARPLLYWFAISLPDKAVHQRAASEFRRSIKSNRELQLESFLAVSPRLVRQRIDQAQSR